MSKQNRKLAAPLSFDEMKQQARAAVLLAGLVMLTALPMLFYQLQYLPDLIFTEIPNSAALYQLAVKQSVVVFALAFLCSLVGFLYAQRLELPGFGALQDIRYWLPLGFGVGLICTPVAYFAIDRELIQILPELYPEFVLPAVAKMVGTAFTQEVVLRFGLLTICVYFLRWGNILNGRRITAVIVIAAFGALGTYLTLVEFQLAHRLSGAEMGLALFLSFVFQWLYSEIYLRWGFLAVVCMHLGFSVKFIVYALVLLR